MNQEQIEKTIQFLLKNQAKFHSDLELMKENQQRTDAQIRALTEGQQALIESQQVLTDNVEAMRAEMRGAFENLIVANEVTRNLALEMGKLIVNVSQRLSIVEQKTKEL